MTSSTDNPVRFGDGVGLGAWGQTALEFLATMMARSAASKERCSHRDSASFPKYSAPLGGTGAGVRFDLGNGGRMPRRLAASTNHTFERVFATVVVGHLRRGVDRRSDPPRGAFGTPGQPTRRRPRRSMCTMGPNRVSTLSPAGVPGRSIRPRRPPRLRSASAWGAR